MPAIQHLWFDFSETIGTSDKARHNELKYRKFAELKGVPVSPAIEQEYNSLFEQHGRSNSNVFVQLGKPNGYWPSVIEAEAANGLYRLMDPAIPDALLRLAQVVKVSVFSNLDTRDVLQSMGVDTSIFTNILSSHDLSQPKPHLEGFHKMVELSDVPAGEILYVGDDEIKDIIPAKEVGLQTGIIWNRSPLATHNFANYDDILTLFSA